MKSKKILINLQQLSSNPRQFRNIFRGSISSAARLIFYRSSDGAWLRLSLRSTTNGAECTKGPASIVWKSASPRIAMETVFGSTAGWRLSHLECFKGLFLMKESLQSGIWVNFFQNMIIQVKNLNGD